MCTFRGAVLFVVGAVVASPLGAVSLRVELLRSTGSSALRQVQVRLVPQPAGGKAQAIEREVEVPGSAELDVPAGVAWQLETAGADTWSAPIPIPAEPGRRSASIRVALLPAGRLTGKLEPPPREPAPALSEVEVRLTPAPDKAAKAPPEHATVRCPVAEGRLACVVPAGSLDLKLKAAGFVPIYRWSVEVTAGKARDLGPLELKRGATLVGRVEMDGSSAVSTACRVRLTPQRAGGLPQHASPAQVAADRRLGELERQARVNDRGFFVFEDVAPGIYQVAAVQEGFVEARLFPVEVRGGLETEIRNPLVLARPVTFEVFLDPPLDPYGARWRLELVSPTPPMEDSPLGSHEGLASADGRWLKAGVAPGKYVLWVEGKDRGRWASEPVEVWPGRPPLHVDLPVLEVRGTISLGSEPLSTTFWFGGKTGPESLRFESDARGHFSGLLPREGKWPIDVALSEGGVQRIILDPIEVKKLPGASYAAVEIQVPDTRLEGEVVDESGHPLPGARVETHAIGPPRNPDTFETDGEGKFAVRGIKPGPLAIQAELPPRSSGWVSASVEEGHPGPRLHLVAREQAEIKGRVASAQGPIAGARIAAWPGVGSAMVADIVDAVTDPAGEFSVRLPAGSGAVTVLVFAPGYALRMLAAAANPHAPLAISVEPAGGTLVVPADGALVHGGTFAPVGMLALWLRMNGVPEDGKVLRVPNVEPGAYVICPPGPDYATLMKGGTPPPGRCAGGVLQPYGELSLLPAPQAAAR
jgi:hypothetical protein